MGQELLQQTLYILANVAYYMLTALDILIFLRVILSWFLSEEDSTFMIALICMTEPVILPFRALLSRLQKTSAVPMDFSPIFASLAIILVQAILSALTGAGQTLS